MLWYIRESSTAVYVSNLPMLWPLFRRAFKVGTFADSSSNKYHSNNDSQPLSDLSKHKKPKKGGADELTGMSYSGSDEMINRQLHIEQRVSFTVEETRVKVEYDEERAS